METERKADRDLPQRLLNLAAQIEAELNGTAPGAEPVFLTDDVDDLRAAASTLTSDPEALKALLGEPVAWTVAETTKDVRPMRKGERIDDKGARTWDPEVVGVVSRRRFRAESWAESRGRVVVPLYAITEETSEDE